ncbi:hypothetical protein Cadr_000001664 [Camelus dromedarius]|uniref:Uncharacterized protein n=1 Tax=Camelus dromedarius TaxID=9838 RepID=A0A5N4EGQ0_CAMDR|nr:hypothetical protein Cadr_000001664 [Camelus dromedarius]
MCVLIASFQPHPILLSSFLSILQTRGTPFSRGSEHFLCACCLKQPLLPDSSTLLFAWKVPCSSPLSLNGASSEKTSLISLFKTGPVPANLCTHPAPLHQDSIYHLTILHLEKRGLTKCPNAPKIGHCKT